VRVDAQNGSQFVVFFVVTTVPGRLQLQVDFGGDGAARWTTPFQGADPVETVSALIGTGIGEKRLKAALDVRSVALLFIEKKSSDPPASQTLVMGDEQPYRIEYRGKHTPDGISNMVPAAGWVGFPGPVINATVAYDGPGSPRHAILATLGRDIPALVRQQLGLSLEVSLAARF
jgi:hypothetical protein